MKIRRGVVVLLIATAPLGFISMDAQAGDGPTGFWWGTDSNGPAPSSSASSCASSTTPWLEPNVSRSGCGHYGGYMGELGGYWTAKGCAGYSNAWNSTAGARSYANFFDSNTDGIGTSGYWFAGGPGMDPNFDGSIAEATAWGQAQAILANSAANGKSGISANIIWMDVEEPGNGIYTGWNEEMSATSCSSVHSFSSCCSTALARATFDGFWAYVWNNTSYFPGVYSSSGIWTGIFGTGSDSQLGDTMEWAADFTTCPNPAPYEWSQAAGSCSSNSPTFFAGISSSHNCAVAWQWAATTSEDYDQIDGNRTYVCK